MMMVLAVFALPGGTIPQAAEDTMTVAAVRFYSPATSTTIVEGTAEIRVGPSASGRAMRYDVQVSVFDSAGLELQRNSWTRNIGAGAASARVTLVESFSFRAAAGQYRVVLRATPEGGRPVERSYPVRAYSARPAVSDLLLASQARAPESDSAVLAPGEVLRAGLVLTTAPVPRLTPLEAVLSYYAEIYPSQPGVTRGELRAEVLGAGDRIIVATPARPMEVAAEGGLSRGSLDLAGLPEGQYRLRLRLRLGDSSVAVEAPFAMGSLAAVTAMAPPAERRAEDLLFDDADSARVDSLFGPLVHILQPEEDRLFRQMAPGGRKRFLKSFWQQRDPTPQTPDNPVMLEFYRAVAYANQEFRERGSGRVEGWRTDRGRIYLRNGRFDDNLRRPSASPRPYEVWKYTRGRMRYYVFYDQSGLGNYRLIGTNDQREQSQIDWEAYLGGENAQDVRQFIR